MKIGDVIYCVESDEIMVITDKFAPGFYAAFYGNKHHYRVVFHPDGAWTYIKIGKL